MGEQLKNVNCFGYRLGTEKALHKLTQVSSADVRNDVQSLTNVQAACHEIVSQAFKRLSIIYVWACLTV